MEIFALDLGNKQTKLKSSKAEYVLPSQILNGNDLPQQLGALGNLGIKREDRKSTRLNSSHLA